MLVLLGIIIISLLIHLPIFLQPEIFLARGNDLTEFFLPILEYSKKQLLEFNVFPLWRTYSVGGLPLVADPQSQIFYLPNALFLLFSTQTSMLLLLFLHSIAGGVAMFALSKKILKLSTLASFFSAALWITSSKLFTYVEAGHWGLITGWTWLPLIMLSLLMLIKTQKRIWTILLAFSAAFLFYSHVFTFLIFAVACAVVVILQRPKKSEIIYLLAAGILCFGLIAPSFFSQIDWAPHTTRQLLLTSPDVYPHWLKKSEFLTSLFWPLQKNIEALGSLDTEKWITLGIMPMLLAFLGILKLPKSKRVILLFCFGIISIVALNNLSPTTAILLKFNWYKTLRVSTRFWFLIIFGSAVLASIWVNKMQKKIKLPLLVFIMIVAIVESGFLSWTRISRPINHKREIATKIYNILAQDPEIFRVLCLNRCIPARSAIGHNIELVDGYATLIEMTYYQQFKHFIQSNWDYYSLSLPPFGTYLYENLQPDPISLGKFNTKYIVSPHILTNPAFEQVGKFDDYYLYKNSYVYPRVYFETHNQAPPTIIKHNANELTVMLDGQSGDLTIANNYSQGWFTQVDSAPAMPIQKTDSSLQKITIPENAKQVRIYYQPKSFIVGLIISAIAILLSFILLTRATL